MNGDQKNGRKEVEHHETNIGTKNRMVSDSLTKISNHAPRYFLDSMANLKKQKTTSFFKEDVKLDLCTHEVRLNQWKLIIKQCQSRPEGQTAKQWMEENGVQENAYYYWLRKARREVYSQMNDRNASLPAAQGKGAVTFAELSMTPQLNPEGSFPFQPAVIIKTSRATMALSNEVSDWLLDRILQEASHA